MGDMQVKMKDEFFKLIITGKVQGVGMRYMIKEFALKNNIKGTVRNLPDGSVEVIIKGNKEDLAEMKNFLRSNPGWSKVENIYEDRIYDETKINELNILDTFKILY